MPYTMTVPQQCHRYQPDSRSIGPGAAFFIDCRPGDLPIRGDYLFPLYHPSNRAAQRYFATDGKFGFQL